MFPEITVTDLSEKLKSEDKFILLDVRELDRNIVGQGNPETSLALSPLQDVQARRLVQNGLGRVSLEKARGCQLDC